jgi:hypothetical protein
MATTVQPPVSSWSEPVAMDAAGRIQLPRAGAVTAARLRIGLGLLWGFGRWWRAHTPTLLH